MQNADLKKKPAWLSKKINLSDCEELDRLFHDSRLNTVCRQARCPNIGECFSQKVATFLILGDICTRNCRFCAVKTGQPESAVDAAEPERVAAAVEELGLRHAVITSVTRDDLADGGAEIFAQTLKAIKHLVPRIRTEVLVSDFQGKRTSIDTVIAAAPDVFAHNLETVPRLYKEVRAQADYRRSLEVLAYAAQSAKHIFIKSGIMLGLGEKEEEVLALFSDLREAGCDFLSIGQYLAPAKVNFPVKEFVSPDKFGYYKKKALKAGFKHVESAPYVRSSYIAGEYFE